MDDRPTCPLCGAKAGLIAGPAVDYQCGTRTWQGQIDIAPSAHCRLRVALAKLATEGADAVLEAERNLGAAMLAAAIGAKPYETDLSCPGEWCEAWQAQEDAAISAGNCEACPEKPEYCLLAFVLAEATAEADDG